MKTTWKSGLVGTSVVMMLVLAGCGGKEARSAQTPAAGGASGVISTQSDGQTTSVKEDDNNKTTMKKSDMTTTETEDVVRGAKVSSTPVPIVYTKSMLQGEKVPFKVVFDKNLGSGQPWKHHIAIVRSYSELKTLYESDQNMNKEMNTEDDRFNFQYMQGYDDKFFEENALIVLFREGSSGSETHTIEGLVKQNKMLCIHMDIQVQGDDTWTCDMADFRTLIKVKQTDIQDVTDIVVYNANQS